MGDEVMQEDTKKSEKPRQETDSKISIRLEQKFD